MPHDFLATKLQTPVTTAQSGVMRCILCGEESAVDNAGKNVTNVSGIRLSKTDFQHGIAFQLSCVAYLLLNEDFRVQPVKIGGFTVNGIQGEEHGSNVVPLRPLYRNWRRRACLHSPPSKIFNWYVVLCVGTWRTGSKSSLCSGRACIRLA